MAKSGYIKIDRGILKHWLWEDKPFSKGQAWIDLLLLAVWKESKELYRGELVERTPGEIFCSIEWLADKWGWNRKTVMRFLDVLERDNMITQTRTKKGTTITIVNWTVYQTQGTTQGTSEGQAAGHANGHARDNRRDMLGTTEGTHYKNINKAKESIKKAEEETRTREAELDRMIEREKMEREMLRNLPPAKLKDPREVNRAWGIPDFEDGDQ